MANVIKLHKGLNINLKGKPAQEFFDVKQPDSAKSSVELYDSEWNETKLHIGSMTDDFIKQGRLKLDEGRMPQNNDEIAMDWNTLLKLGYAGELGQKITIYYYRADNINYESDQRIETYTLVGIFQNYTNNSYRNQYKCVLCYIHFTDTCFSHSHLAEHIIRLASCIPVFNKLV